MLLLMLAEQYRLCKYTALQMLRCLTTALHLAFLLTALWFFGFGTIDVIQYQLKLQCLIPIRAMDAPRNIMSGAMDKRAQVLNYIRSLGERIAGLEHRLYLA